jgi:hypothetical protein
MNWLPGDRYHQKSDDGRYTVAKYSIKGPVRYEAWRSRLHDGGPHLLASNLPTADEARRLCEEDARA